jgi:hypothetical protein
MKKLTLSNITTSAAAKIKSGTFQHVMDSYEEGFESVINSLIGESLDTSKYYILSGCVNSGSGNNYIISAGVVYHAGSGDFYIVPSATVTRTGSNVIALVITSAYRTGTNFDPVTFTDGSTHNMHRDDTAIWTDTATLGANDFVNMIRLVGSTTPTLTANYSAGAVTPKFVKYGNVVSMKGIITMGASSATGQTITTLNSDYWPTSARVITTLLNDGGGNFRLAGITITTAGVVTLTWCNSAATVSGTTSGFNIYLDGLNYCI